MVSIHNQEENDFLLNTWIMDGSIWIGAIKNGSTWSWSDGSKWHFDIWSKEQPSGGSDYEDNDK